MEKIKIIQQQDSGLKTNPIHSGETSINLSKDIKELLYNESFDEDTSVRVTFTLYKEDFLRALCFIVSKLPLYKTTSQDAKVLNFTTDLFAEYQEKIDDFFKDSESAEYSCNLLIKKDDRAYLNDLRVGKFSIRDFLIDQYSQLIFGKNADDSLYIRVKCEDTKAMSRKLLISEKQHCVFALQCIAYFYNSNYWSNIEKYVQNIEIGKSVKVAGKTFKLTGLFKYDTEENITRLNQPRRRWYLEPFEINGHVLYLSTEWYPGDFVETNKKYDLEISTLARFIAECFGPEFVVRRNDDTWELWQESGNIVNGEPKKEPKPDTKNTDIENLDFSIMKTISLIKETGLIYEDILIKRFAFSLMSKRFLILSGLAGSGKTQLALAFASALIESDKQMCVVSVGADWTNREPLLGFPNALNEDFYIKPECGALDLLIEAEKDQERPYFLILDEMNMSYVERYFADFLSAMESHKPIALWKGNDQIPAKVSLPKNLFIIGTINVDETTYMFSPKVLDRANVIEFKISSDEMSSFLNEMKPIDRDSINYKAAGMGSSFVKLADCSEIAETDTKTIDTLSKFFNNLKSVNAEFGYRSASEIYRFIKQAGNNDDTAEHLKREEILDCAIVQKLLPKLHGSRKKLEPVLQALWKECFKDEQQKETQQIIKENVGNATLKLTADKIQRMYDAAYTNGFTSFAEA